MIVGKPWRYIFADSYHVKVKESYVNKGIKNPCYRGAPSTRGKSAPAAYLIYSSFPSLGKINCNFYPGYPTVWANSTRWVGLSLNSVIVFSLSQL